MAVYLVKTSTEKRLVKAKAQAAAINHVVRPGVTAEPLNPDQLADFLADAENAGVKIEVASVVDEQAA